MRKAQVEMLAGLRQRLTIAVGSWAGQAGDLMAKDLLALLEAFNASLCTILSLEPEQIDVVLRALPHEWDTYHTSYTSMEVHGQR